MSKRMITYFVLCSVIALQACSSGPTPVKVNGMKNGMDVMSRVEVVQASKECVYARMHPNVQYIYAPTEYGKVMVPVSVNCEPYLPKQ